MRRTTLLVLGCAGLAACASPEEMRAKNLQGDSQQCAAAGFTPGSIAMAQCMDTAAKTRAADAYRAQQWERDQAAQRAKSDAEWQARIAASAAKNRADADAFMNGSGANGPGQMHACSDGALRADCADAPAGY